MLWFLRRIPLPCFGVRLLHVHDLDVVVQEISRLNLAVAVVGPDRCRLGVALTLIIKDRVLLLLLGLLSSVAHVQLALRPMSLSTRIGWLSLAEVASDFVRHRMMRSWARRLLLALMASRSVQAALYGLQPSALYWLIVELRAQQQAGQAHAAHLILIILILNR